VEEKGLLVLAYLIVNAEGLVRVLDKLVDGESCVVWLHNGIADLRAGHDGECGHHAIWEFLADLGDQQSTHTSTSTTTERVSDLKALKTVTTLSLTTNDIEDLVHKLSTLSVVALGPVISSA
jgi:hypothetical protein